MNQSVKVLLNSGDIVTQSAAEGISRYLGRAAVELSGAEWGISDALRNRRRAGVEGHGATIQALDEAIIDAVNVTKDVVVRLLKNIGANTIILLNVERAFDETLDTWEIHGQKNALRRAQEDAAVGDAIDFVEVFGAPPGGVTVVHRDTATEQAAVARAVGELIDDLVKRLGIDVESAEAINPPESLFASGGILRLEDLRGK
jgi:plasmid maintenance system antidote protein VapI